MNEQLAYFADPSPITDPGPYAYLYDDLPDDIPTLFKIIQGEFIHSQHEQQRYWQQQMSLVIASFHLTTAIVSVPRGIYHVYGYKFRKRT